MRLKHSIFLLIIMMGTSESMRGQSPEVLAARAKVYEGYVTDNQEIWLEGIASLEKLYKNSKDKAVLSELALSSYGMTGYCLAHEACLDEDEWIDKTEDLLDEMLELDEEWAFAHAMKGALLAIKIGLSPAKALFIGPKSAKHIEKATELGPNNPMAWVEMGNMRFHSPGIFGGDIDKAITCFSRSIDLFDEQTELREENWYYLHAMAWLGKSYEEKEEWAEAKKVYERLLEKEPEFHWAKNELLPAINARLNP